MPNRDISRNAESAILSLQILNLRIDSLGSRWDEK